MHSRAQAMLDGVPDQGEQPRLTADPLSPRPFANPYETAVYPIQGAFRAFGLEGGTCQFPFPPLAPPSTLATACVKLISSSVKARLKEGAQSTSEGLLTAVDCGCAADQHLRGGSIAARIASGGKDKMERGAASKVA